MARCGNFEQITQPKNIDLPPPRSEIRITCHPRYSQYDHFVCEPKVIIVQVLIVSLARFAAKLFAY